MKQVKMLLLVLALLLVPIFPAQGETVSVTAQAAIVMDSATGEILFEKDIDTLRVPASMTKIMTVYIVYEEIAKGNLTKESTITISPAAAAMSRDSSFPMAIALTEGADYTVDEMIALMMVPSASAACFAVAEHISGSEAEFVKLMNQTARELGLNAEFRNAHGARVHYISARSVADLIRIFINKYPDILHYSSMNPMDFRGTAYPNTNRLLPGGSYFYAGVDGFKTGTIPEAGFCLSATAVRGETRLISVVMNSSSTDARHLDSQKLLDYGFAELERRQNAIETTEVTFINYPETVRIGADHLIQVEATGVSRPYITKAVFTANGKIVQEYDTMFVSPNQVFQLEYYHERTPGTHVEIAFVLSPRSGDPKATMLKIPISSQSPLAFRDIDGHWAQGPITTMAEKGIFSGYPNHCFLPEDQMTRGDFVAVLWALANALGVDTTVSTPAFFSDVDQTDWRCDRIDWAWENQIVAGYGYSFGVNDLVSREQAAVILCNFITNYGLDQSAVTEAAFLDWGDISLWAADAVYSIAAWELMRGFPDGNFYPAASVNRAEVATIFAKILE